MWHPVLVPKGDGSNAAPGRPEVHSKIVRHPAMAPLWPFGFWAAIPEPSFYFRRFFSPGGRGGRSVWGRQLETGEWYLGLERNGLKVMEPRRIARWEIVFGIFVTPGTK